MRPDGDAIGSALALSRALDVLGIENSVSDESDIPSNLSFLTGTEKIGKGFFKEADLYIAVDSADEQRLGALADDFRAVSRKKIPSISTTTFPIPVSQNITTCANVPQTA